MAAERWADHEDAWEVRHRLAQYREQRARTEAAMQVFASVPGEGYKPLEERHTARELARRVALLERQVAATERERDDALRRLANAEIALRRLRERRPWWRRARA